MADSIQLRGIRAVGRHGVLDEEHQRAQPFEVDLDLAIDLTTAGRTDALADTVDYGAIAQLVVDQIGGEHAELLEHLADRIARATLDAGPAVTSVQVTLRKLRPPVPVDMASAGVTIRRVRAGDAPGGAGRSPADHIDEAPGGPGRPPVAGR
ncbi:MAG TPA: dihydroneopterin aldolase [Acidimicrobiales bacterium]|jgi:dihydroneopterin aldolase/2-amino-4-hydroxy-6-hydroxymethyldihydropteridine diphosphokinase|nr:dihydroneopterin aldolase [Acidimicrobiales bacterium]